MVQNSRFCVAVFRTILVLFDYSEANGQSSLLSVRLYCPFDRVKVLRKNAIASKLHYNDGVAYLCSARTKIVVLEIKPEKIHVKDKRQTKPRFVQMLERFRLASTGTAAQIKSRLERYLKETRKQYKDNNVEEIQCKQNHLLKVSFHYPKHQLSSLHHLRIVAC